MEVFKSLPNLCPSSKLSLKAYFTSLFSFASKLWKNSSNSSFQLIRILFFWFLLIETPLVFPSFKLSCSSEWKSFVWSIFFRVISICFLIRIEIESCLQTCSRQHHGFLETSKIQVFNLIPFSRESCSLITLSRRSSFSQQRIDVKKKSVWKKQIFFQLGLMWEYFWDHKL